MRTPAILRLTVIIAAAAGSLILTATPALAYPHEGGTRTCPRNHHVAAKTRGAGEMYARVHVGIVYAHSSVVRDLYNAEQT